MSHRSRARLRTAGLAGAAVVGLLATGLGVPAANAAPSRRHLPHHRVTW
jgi:hypothetical protein